MLVKQAPSKLPSDSQWTSSGLLISSQQIQQGCNLVTSFGELFWRDSQRTHSGRLPADSQRTPSGLPADSQRAPSKLPTNFQQASIRLPKTSTSSLFKTSFGDLIWRPHLESSFWETIGLTVDSQQTHSGLSTNFQQAPNRLLYLETSFGDLFGELIWRAHLERQLDSHQIPSTQWNQSGH